MKLFQRKKKDEKIVVDHGRGDVRVYPSTGSQLHIHLQHEKKDADSQKNNKKE